MNHKLIAPHPTPGELAEQRHLVDPLDHKFEHLADEQHPASAPQWSEREAAIVARLDDEDRTASELTDIVTELLDKVGRALAELAARPSRAEVLREAADMIVAKNDRILWATRPGKHWAADLLRHKANEATPGVTA